MSEHSIVVQHLTKKFHDFTAVNDISFSVKRGEIFAFLGPNGAGKSTTIKMLTTLLEPTSGEVTLNNFNVLHQQNVARNSFGIVFQDPSLDEELSAYENMELHAVLYHVTRSEQQQRIQKLLEFVELWDRRDAFVKTFSGGMRRRLEVARGLLHHPAVLFLDEPTIGLDPQTRNHMWEYIRNLNKEEGMTVFFTTHYMEEADKMADRIAVIDHGQIITEGTSAELKAKTNTTSLEDAFLQLTGKAIREEEVGSGERMRMMLRSRVRR